MRSPEDWCRPFSALLDLAVPGEGSLALLAAYFDASKRKSGVFAVAGFAFGLDRAKKAARQWRALWGDVQCHMTDLHSRAKGSAFENLSPPEAGEMLKKSVKIINASASYGVAVSCDLDELYQLAPKSTAPGQAHYLPLFRHAYATCAHLAMFSLGGMIQAGSHPESRVAYFFESGDDNLGEAARFWHSAIGSQLQWEYSHYSHIIIRKKDARLLEMSDILAWEWAKQQERSAAGMPMRPSLRALLDPQNDGLEGPTGYTSQSRRAFHITGKPLETYFHKAKTIILEIE